jgi:hypothetical protein
VGAPAKQAKKKPAFWLSRILQVYERAWVVTVLPRDART